LVGPRKWHSGPAPHSHGGGGRDRILDYGPEFTSRVLDAWAYEHGIRLHFIRPGKPIENCFVESVNGKFRDECLNENRFTDIPHARRHIAGWRIDYNEVRPHSALENPSPRAFAE
jgi:putative transposase